MADTAAPAKGLGATLGKKVGPLPLGIWLAGGAGILWYFRKEKSGSGSGSTPAATQSQTGYGTDAAGNTGYIDPETGYVYGSAEDIDALQQQGTIGQNSYNTDSGTSGSTGDGGTADTSGQTTGTTTGSGTSVTTPGAPPGPTATAPGAPAATSKNWKYPAPSGLAASNVSDSGYSLSWQPVQGPAGQKPQSYTVATYQMNGVKVDQFTSGSTSTKEYGAGGKGLKPGWQYRTDVWANGGPVAPAHASVVVTIKPKGTK